MATVTPDDPPASGDGASPRDADDSRADPAGAGDGRGGRAATTVRSWPDPPTEPEADDPETQRRTAESDAALTRYGRRMRRQRRRYYVTIGIVAVLLLTWVIVAWQRGEISHVTLKTAARPAPSVALEAPAGTQARAWTSGDHTALGTPYWGGTVVTYSTHAVRGRNASTGAITWSYNRSDRTVCAAAQIKGVTVAVYRIDGDCQEVTGLDSGTGKRVWTRTLFENADPIRGTPTFSMSSDTLMITAPQAIYAIAPAVDKYDNGIDRWLFAQQGCRINSAVYGTNGALISQTCTGRDCSGLKYCANGPQLVLRDGYRGQSDDDQYKANPDMIKWIRPNTSEIPVSADSVVSAYNPTSGSLDAYDPDTGSPVGQDALGAGHAAGDFVALASDGGELVWVGGRLRLFNSGGTTTIWSVTATGAPTLTATRPTSAVYPPLDQSLLVVPSTSGVSLLDSGTGAAGRDVTGLTVPQGDRAWPLGDGFVVAGTTTSIYR